MKKYRLNIIILLLISFFVIILALKDNFSVTIDYIMNSNILWIIIAIIIMILSIFFQSLSLLILIKKIDKKFTIKNSIILTFAGLFFNGITPFSTGGQPFQVYFLNKNKIKISDASNILLQNFITYQISLILIGTIAIIYNSITGLFPNSNFLKRIVVLGYIINIIILLLLILLSFAKKINTTLFNKILNFIFKFKFIKNKEQKRRKINEILDNFYNGSLNLSQNKNNFFKSFLCNFLSLILLYLVPLFIFYSMNDFKSLNAIKTIVSSGYTYLIGSFVPIPGATGGLEYGYNEFFMIYREGAFLSATLLIWRFITYYLGMILGGISLLFIRKGEKA